MPRTIVIPDIHTKFERAEAMLATELWDHAVLLGDYFDDWNDSVEANKRTANWLGECLDDYKQRFTCLWGNHDQSYLTPNAKLRCSGYTQEKAEAIRSRMQPYLNQLVGAVMVEGWLLTHAGLTKYLKSEDMTAENVVDYLNGAITLTQQDTRFLPNLCGIGYLRDGTQPVGGITWCDWSEFEPVEEFGQIFGHTQHKEPQYRGNSVCLDTRLNHYAIIEDGILSVHKYGTT